jgi:protein O-GlcNAc transferase
MDQRLVQVDGLLKAGKAAAACDLLIAYLTENPGSPVNVYRVLTLQLYNLKRYEDGALWAERAVTHHPRDFSLLNTRGVILRRLGRYEEALKVLDQAQKLDPKSPAPTTNKGNIYNDMGNGPAAEAIFAKLSRADPRNPEYHRSLGRALLNQKKYDAGLARCRQAITLKKDYVDAWLDWSGGESGRGNLKAALEVADKAIAAVPGEGRLIEAKAVILRRMGLMKATEEFLTSLLPTHGDKAWLQNSLGGAIADRDRARANEHLKRAVELEPDNIDYRAGLMESYERSRYGDEGANIESAYQLLGDVLDRDDLQLTPKHTKVFSEILIRVCAFEDLPKVGTFSEIGRAWAETGRHTALLKHLARVETPEDRHELLAQHKVWGDAALKAVAHDPIRRPNKARTRDKIRVGFMSSDLRAHPVGYFAYPLFEAIDKNRFDVFVYSFNQGQEDAVQRFIASQVTAFRWNPEISAHDAAQMIADDDLDILIELGGSTHMNKLEVMAFRPARLHASWLGYPHSAGLTTIDYIVLDPQIVPPDRSLILEEPMLMPRTWLALGRRAFSENYVINPGVPEDNVGHITFGTANNPHKYNEATLRAWAKVVAAVPGSRFKFIRPEGGTPTFRKNVERWFAKEGVTADRIEYRAVRGLHMAYYNELDITLDPFPLTGGTTTCEALWMGVPVINLRGEALFERLSYSILTNLGLADLSTPDLDEYVRIAVGLARDRDRRLELRHTLRERMKASPLGQNEQFARDFYDLVARTVEGRLPVAAQVGA